jgi:hypothetical protein
MIEPSFRFFFLAVGSVVSLQPVWLVKFPCNGQCRSCTANMADVNLIISPGRSDICLAQESDASDGDGDVYVVEAIRDHKADENGNVLLLVKWKVHVRAAERGEPAYWSVHCEKLDFMGNIIRDSHLPSLLALHASELPTVLPSVFPIPSPPRHVLVVFR